MKKYNSSELVVFKEILLKLKAIEETQVSNLNESLSSITDNGKEENGIDSTSYSVQIESIMNSKSRAVKHLLQINNALLRIDNNRYGVCSVMGELISKERLMAVPTTTMSIEGKILKEKQK